MMPMGNNAPSSANFYFTGEAESIQYEMIPHFKGQDCVAVRVRRK